MKIYTKAGMNRINNMFDKRRDCLVAIDNILGDKAEELKAKYDIEYYVKTMEYLSRKYEDCWEGALNYCIKQKSEILSETNNLWKDYLALLENKNNI